MTKFGASNHAVILAGGGGTRLWPVSRKGKPKQFQALVGERSLLQRMYATLGHFFARENIHVQTTEDYLAFVREQLPGIDPDRIIVEPEARDTAAAFAFAAATLLRRDPDSSLGIFYSDNVVQDESKDEFRAAIETGFSVIRQYPERAVLVGVKPLYPHTGLGYIELGPEVASPEFRVPVFCAKSFVEKPALDLARELTASPNYLWNTGYKIIRAKTILRLLASSHESYASGLPALIDALAADDAKAIRTSFASLHRCSFEYLVSEKAPDFLTIPANVQWSDLGDWEIIHRVLAEHREGRLYSSGRVVEHDCKDTLLISHHRPVVAIGVQDLIIIETEEAVLVMSKNRSQDIKVALRDLFATEPELL